MLTLLTRDHLHTAADIFGTPSVCLLLINLLPTVNNHLLNLRYLPLAMSLE